MSVGKSATPLGKVRGLGSAHHGGQHWLEERFTSVALVILSFWLLFALAMLPDFSLATMREWLKSGWAAVPLALFVIAAFKHGVDGLKVVIDDYVHDEGNRVALSMLLSMAGIAGAAAALFALAKFVFGAA